MNNIVWLASYPKSGNTWFRIFLTNLLGGMSEPADINDLNFTPIASHRGLFDNIVGIEASDLTHHEIERLRPSVYDHISRNLKTPFFMKVHDAYTLVDSQTPLFPTSATKCVIYLIRNPLDVAVSFAHHSGWDYDTSIMNMADNRMAFCSKNYKLHIQLRQTLLTWSGHVKSWTEQSELPVCVLRYEDMKNSPLETFKKAVRFAGLDFSDKEIAEALKKCTIEELQRQESENGFREKSYLSKAFFRKGEAGAWKDDLTEAQARQVEYDHEEIMQIYGYKLYQGAGRSHQPL